MNLRRNLLFFLGPQKFKRKFWLFLFVFALEAIYHPLWFILTFPTNFTKDFMATRHFPVDLNKEKLILFLDFPRYYELRGKHSFSCQHKCKFTTQSNLSESADAVVVYSHDHILGRNIFDLIKSPGQIWVFFAVESPPYSHQHSLAGQSFDWTMTYRLDSDIFFGYIKTFKKPLPTSFSDRERDMKKMKKAFHKKTKMVAWMVSHCKTFSRREKYVNELSRYIQVDVYGACGSQTCGNWSHCDQMVARDYKFYLSFENSLCKDYASEKLLKILQKRTTVPIVRGGADYKKICPPDSVIDTADFASAADLATYLEKLANDEEAYTNLLKWGWEYQVVPSILPVCDVCEKLHTTRTVQPYRDVVKWWTEGACHPPRDL